MKIWVTRIVLVLVIAGVLAGAFFGYQAATKPAELLYRTSKIERGSLTGRVTATGTLSARVTVLVGSQVSGRISQINVDYNSSVKKGEVIARIDPQLFEAAVASQRANLLAAEGALIKARAQVDDAQKKLDRAKAGRAEGLISQADLDTATTTLEVARGEVESQKGQHEQARASLHQAEINLAYCTISSPIDGTVISRAVDVGQTVAASLQAPTLFTIAEDLHKMQVDTNITEGDVGKLRDSMKAQFTVDAYANERFTGTISQVRNAATTVQNVVTYDAVIGVDNPDLKLKPGMTANVTIVFDRRDNVLRVPNAALRFRAPAALTSAMPAVTAAPAPTAAASDTPAAAPAATGSSGSSGRWRRNREAGDPTSKTVWVMRGGPRPVPVTIKVGLSDGTFTEVVSGDLEDGDAVVTEAVTEDGAAAPTAKPTGGANMPRMRL